MVTPRVSESESSETESSSCWKFHPLPTGPRSAREDESAAGVDDDADAKGVVGGSLDGFKNYCGGDDDDTAARFEDDDALALGFDVDGFLCISDVLLPRHAQREGDEKDDDDEDADFDVVGTLRDLAARHLSEVFRELYDNGHSPFPLSHRRRVECEGAGALAEGADEGRASSVDGEGDGDGRSVVTVSGCGNYEYPMKCGIKNGFKEVVMRSPGRYELAILNNNDVVSGFSGSGSGEKGGGLPGNVEESPASFPSAAGAAPLLMEHVRRHVLSNDDLLGLVRSLLVRRRLRGRQKESATATAAAPTAAGGSICRSGDGDAIGNDEVDDDGGVDDDVHRDTDSQHDDHGEEEEDDDDEGYRLLSVSIVVSAPGADDQGWHADGGHVNRTKHETCHCLNVFLPLTDAEDEMELKRLGPTELRPGTHHHTRNLAPMMLAARARKTLRPPALPLVRAGDALIFDYRVLHRGRANATGHGGDEGEGDGIGIDRGRCRPVLVLTFARSWFRDVLNFPRRSLHRHEPPPQPSPPRDVRIVDGARRCDRPCALGGDNGDGGDGGAPPNGGPHLRWYRSGPAGDGGGGELGRMSDGCR